MAKDDIEGLRGVAAETEKLRREIGGAADEARTMLGETRQARANQAQVQKAQEKQAARPSAAARAEYEQKRNAHAAFQERHGGARPSSPATTPRQYGPLTQVQSLEKAIDREAAKARTAMSARAETVKNYNPAALNKTDTREFLSSAQRGYQSTLDGAKRAFAKVHGFDSGTAGQKAQFAAAQSDLTRVRRIGDALTAASALISDLGVVQSKADASRQQADRRAAAQARVAERTTRQYQRPAPRARQPALFDPRKGASQFLVPGQGPLSSPAYNRATRLPSQVPDFRGAQMRDDPKPIPTAYRGAAPTQSRRFPDFRGATYRDQGVPAPGAGPVVVPPPPPPPPKRPTAGAGGFGADDEDRTNRANEQAKATRSLAASQQEAAAAQARWRSGFQSSTLALNESKNAMRSHGVMSQQFISTAARGEASWREWGYQIGSVTAKFAGWAVAGAGVYGVFKGIQRVGQGAVQSAGIEGGLGRSIQSNLDPNEAKRAVIDLSSQYNVSTKDAELAIEIQSRKFGNLKDSIEAAKVSLYAMKVGDLGIEDASKYTTAIANGLQIGKGNAKELQSVFDQINQAQNLGGVPIKETMAGFATAAGTFTNAGGDRTQLLSLIATIEKSTGRSGKEAGTAVQRMASFIQRPSNQAKLEAFGVDTGGTISETIDSAFNVADQLIKSGQKSKVNRLAEALADPQIGSRIAPALANGEMFRRGEELYSPEASAGASQKELESQLSRFTERLAMVGNGLERLGVNLEQSGLLNIFGLIVIGAGKLLDVVNAMFGAFNMLPDEVRTVVSGLVTLELALLAMRRFNTAGTGGRGAGLIAPTQFASDKKLAGQTTRLAVSSLKDEAAKTATQVQRADLSRGLAAQNVAALRADVAKTKAGTAARATAETALNQALREETLANDRYTQATLRAVAIREELNYFLAQQAAIQQSTNAAQLRAAQGAALIPVQRDPNRTTTRPQETIGGQRFIPGTTGQLGPLTQAQAREAERTASTAAASANYTAQQARQRAEQAQAAAAASAAAASSARPPRSGVFGRVNDTVSNPRQRLAEARERWRTQGTTYGLARGFGYNRLQSSYAQAGALGTGAMTAAGGAVTKLTNGVKGLGSSIAQMLGPLGLAIVAFFSIKAAANASFGSIKKRDEFNAKNASGPETLTAAQLEQFRKDREKVNDSGGLVAKFRRGLYEGSRWDPLESTCRHASLSIL